MTPDQARLLRDSFAELVPLTDSLAAAFYERLFAIDPDLAPLFADIDRVAQGRRLMAALEFVVNGADRPDTLLIPLQELAWRHIRYGAHEQHFLTVGEALMDTLAGHFGPRFTPPLRAAWRAAYAMVSRVMIEAVRESPVAPRRPSR